MVEVSKPVGLGQLSAELGGVPLWSSGPDADGVTTVWGGVDSAALAGAVAALTATVRALAAAVAALDDEEQTRAATWERRSPTGWADGA